MPIVIKEIHVSTVVEKRVILPDQISEQAYLRLKEQVLTELAERRTLQQNAQSKKER